MVRALRGERGQALVLGVLILALIILVALSVSGLALALAARARAQSAADAAALACATQGAWTERVDARGRVYGVTVAVRPTSGPLAAASAWRANLARSALTTVTFRAVAAGPACRVAARVNVRLGPLGVLGSGRQALTWVTQAEARAYAPSTAGAGTVGDGAGAAGLAQGTEVAP